MTGRLITFLLACIVLFGPSAANARSEKFSFGIIAHAFTNSSEESVLRSAIAAADAENLAFVVANGIKSKTEPCTDQIYNRRKELLDEAGHGLILSLAASDWADCRRNDGRSASMERLNRVRDVFFAGEFSLGSTRIPVIRQSLMPKFRNYGENARWRINDVMFATINLPANNNHYLQAAGRNSEFEDRLVANRAWLEQLFNAATRKNLQAIVIFCDGNPFVKSNATFLFGQSRDRDGYTEIRRKITALASKFPGKVMLVHGQNPSEHSGSANVVWHDKVGTLAVSAGWTKLTVDSSISEVFAITTYPTIAKNPMKQ